MDKENIKAGAYLGRLWGSGPPGSPKGAPKRKKKRKGKETEREKKKERKKERKKRKRREKERTNERKRGQERKKRQVNMTRGAPCSFRRKLGLKEWKLQGRQIDDEKRWKHWTFSNLFHFWYLNKKCRVPLSLV